MFGLGNTGRALAAAAEITVTTLGAGAVRVAPFVAPIVGTAIAGATDAQAGSCPTNSDAYKCRLAEASLETAGRGSVPRNSFVPVWGTSEGDLMCRGEGGPVKPDGTTARDCRVMSGTEHKRFDHLRQ